MKNINIYQQTPTDNAVYRIAFNFEIFNSFINSNNIYVLCNV